MVPAELDDYIAPENKARIRIDEMLQRAGWVVQDYKSVNLYAGSPDVCVGGSGGLNGGRVGAGDGGWATRQVDG